MKKKVKKICDHFEVGDKVKINIETFNKTYHNLCDVKIDDVEYGIVRKIILKNYGEYLEIKTKNPYTNNIVDYNFEWTHCNSTLAYTKNHRPTSQYKYWVEVELYLKNTTQTCSRQFYPFVLINCGRRNKLERILK